MHLSPQAAALARTLAFFAQFHRGLTLEELYRSAWGLPIDDVVGPLSELTRAGHIEAEGEYVTLRAGTPQLPASRQHERAVLAEPLVQRATRIARWIARLPFVRGVFLVNSLALGTNHARSDIDLFIIAAPKHLWSVRLAATLLVQLAGIRRHAQHTEGRVCLSFFATEDALNLASIRIAEDDIYLAYWIATAQYLAGVCSQSLLLVANPWVHALLPNGAPVPDEPPRPAGRVERGLAWTRVDVAAEWCARCILRPITRRHAERLGNPPGVLFSDTLQKFHDVDKRAAFRDAWIARCAMMGA